MFVYILRCKGDNLYTGITTDFCRRIRQHTGKIKGGAKYTRSYPPLTVEVVWYAEDDTVARKAEYLIKKLSRKEKEILISYPEKINEKFSECKFDCVLREKDIDKVCCDGVSLNG